ncbi:MAG: ADP-ribosylglycohydrolase family protein [Chloroflexia bacterium]|nr:ADP-ribosylglycohydrolase family protein [Chloroflexia bacterium]MDQ3512090.1 ADP-ribosylglycohydrolase family protein [Chloroflexota bacterium]
MDDMAGPSLSERYLGCLVGLACGDALGGPFEFRSRDAIAREHPKGPREFTGGGWLSLAPGEITDDTQMTMALARSCGPGGLDMDRLVAEFLDWYRSDPKDIGGTTRSALARLAGGESWEEAGEAVQREAGPRGAAGNGTVMRCAPAGMRFRRDPAGLVRASIDSARITHADPRCTWGAVAVNQAIAHLLDGGETAGAPAAAIEGVPEKRVRDAVTSAAGTSRDDLRAGGYVLDTIRSALWCLANHGGFEETVVAAVSLGDDADTTGAVTGALAGAAYGIGAIPARWRDAVQHRDELERLAVSLLTWSEA